MQRWNMMASTTDESKQIRVSAGMPNILRIGLGLAGALICAVTILELGGGLWPPSFLTLFFGIIVVGGSSLGLAIMLHAAFAPDTIWTFAPGSVTIELILRGRSETHRFERSAFSALSIAEVPGDSSPTTYRLDCRLADPSAAFQHFPNQRLFFALSPFITTSPFALIWNRLLGQTRRPESEHLHSPAFHSLKAAEAARAVLDIGVDRLPD
jgi:hypothetical protein